MKNKQPLRNVVTELAAVESMTVGELAAKHVELFGAPTRSRNKAYLRKRIAWRIQELAEGGLSERALARIIELGDTLPERWRARLIGNKPAAAPPRDPRLPAIGTTLTRIHRGTSHRVVVRDDGFEYAGEVFKTLSAIAKRITGTAWNGFAFFSLPGRSATNREHAA